MPIKPENKKLYPKNWKEIVERVRKRSGDKCEKCGAKNHEPHPLTGSMVVLTTAHLDHDPRNCKMSNLRHWCQKCHNSYDAPHRRENARKTRNAKRGIVELDFKSGGQQ